jgi:hypothetical protein
LTPAADVYSLAKTTYMVLTGEAPRRFSQKPITQLPQEFAAEPWAGYVLRVLERATQINPLKRHQTVDEFWRELRDATMAQTRPLHRPDGGAAGTGEAEERGYRDDSGSRGFTPAPPPAPTFDRESRSANNSGRHRFVVPIGATAPAAAAVVTEFDSAPFPAPRAEGDAPERAYTERRPERESRASGISPRLRKWGVALLLLLAFSGMLYATFRYVRNVRGGEVRQGQQAPTQPNRQGAVGAEMLAGTDINLRKGPDPSYTKVGMAESGSRVKVLQVSGKWCQVQVIEHSRPKSDPDSEDEGWVNSTLLKPKS